MAERSPYTGEKLIEGVNADIRGGRLRARDPYEGMYNEANKALTDYATSLRADQPTMEADISAQGEAQRRTIEAQRQEGLGTIGTQRTQARAASESAIAEARRIASEQMKGLQAQFGSATGTGGFTGEIMGRETARNIAGTRTQLAQTMDELNLAETSLIREADNQIFQLETQTNAAINDSRRQLRDQLAQINLQKGQLEADKATQRINALQNYQLTLRQLEAQKEQSMMQIEANRQSALQNFEFEKALIAERAKYDTSGSGGGVGAVDVADKLKVITSYNELIGASGIPAGMNADQYYNMIATGQPIFSSYFQGQGSSTDAGVNRKTPAQSYGSGFLGIQ